MKSARLFFFVSFFPLDIEKNLLSRSVINTQYDKYIKNIPKESNFIYLWIALIWFYLKSFKNLLT